MRTRLFPLRNAWLFAGLLLIVTAAGLQSCATTPPALDLVDDERIDTSSGQVRGYTDNGDVISWLDIPYARAPVGELRWRAPRPLDTPAVVRERSPVPIACPQLPGSAAAGLDGDGVVGDEDCLYLDIRAPAGQRDGLPVMVWIHGGGNTSGYKGAYDFSTMVATQKVLVVAINYRLGPLGWLTHPSIQGGAQGTDRSSNFGTLDIIAALKWVQRNIDAFGGDPGRVTVFGESAGAHNIYALLASPLAKGLFDGAIAQSGYVSDASPEDAFNAGNANPEIARSSTALAVQLGLAGSPDAAADVSRDAWLQTPAAELIKAWEGLPDIGFEVLTTADAVVVPAGGILAGLRSLSSDDAVPVIAGANRDEVTLWLAASRYFVDASYPLTRLGPPKLALRDPQMYAFWVDVRSRAWKLRGVDEPLAALAASGFDELYAYRFSWDEQSSSWFADFPRLIGAAHGVEISFLTGDWYYGPITDFIYPDSASRDQLSATMMQAWAEFAKQGSPPRSLEWAPWTPAKQPFLELDSPSVALQHESKQLTQLLDTISKTPLLSEVERCTFLWDSLVNIGEPDYAAYRDWQQGRCATVDVKQEKRRIRAALEAAHGSASTL